MEADDFDIRNYIKINLPPRMFLYHQIITLKMCTVIDHNDLLKPASSLAPWSKLDQNWIFVVNWKIKRLHLADIQKWFTIKLQPW